MSNVRLIPAFLIICVIGLCSCNGDFWTVYKDSNGYRLTNVKDPLGVAYAFYKDEIEETGWARLEITTNSNYPDNVQMYAAGYLEGSVSVDRIWQGWLNNGGSSLPQNVTDWFQQNINWMKLQITQQPSSEYWLQVSYVLAQLQGLTDGYNAHASSTKQFTFVQQFMASAGGDLIDIIPALLPGNTEELMSPSDLAQYIFNTHCSALIRLTPGNNELFTGHTTWSSFSGMLRSYKIYNFHLNDKSTAATSVSFSGYPGVLTSVDDYFITSQSLSVTETTNGVMNFTLYNSLTPKSVLSWIRTIVANRMATSSPEWVKYFSLYNSGTYNNQWMVVDFKKFTASAPIPADTFWILEQIPGLIESADMSVFLEQNGYWPSYNIPFFKNIFVASGFQTYVDKYGPWFSYHGSPRALIFKRDHSTVTNFDKMKWIMRYNNWEYDPLAQGNAGNGISSRFDLVNQTNEQNPFLAQACFGGIDSKISSSRDTIEHFRVTAISGPTFYEQPAFAWTPQWSSSPHVGQPEEFLFDWEVMEHKL